MTRTDQGQWAQGFRDPRNPNEVFKAEDDGLNVRQRIIDVYSKTGFAGIDPTDLRGRFRWFGLYTQRKPGIPGRRTAVLEPEELEDEHFMLRIRIDGGQLTSHQLRTVAQIATEFGRDVADVTDRQNVQLHWIRVEDVPEIWNRLEAVGLSTTEACGDTPRVILGCPLAGVAEDEIIDATPQIREVAERYVGDPAFSNLPRKFKSSISGCGRHCTNHEVNDVSFVGVRNDAGEVGYDVWVGGGLSTNPKIAVRLGVFVEPARVTEVWAGVISIFRDHGYRVSRNRSRLKFLVADWGAEKFREVLERDYLSSPLPDGPAPEVSTSRERDHVGVQRQKDGNYALGFAFRAGRTSGTMLRRIANLAEWYGSGLTTATAQQHMVIRGVPESSVDELVTELEQLDLMVKPSPFRRGTMACTGVEFCKLAIVATKSRADWLFAELEKRLPDFDESITINVNGCPNSCARFQIADIGFKGQVQRDSDGNDTDGFQVHLGGHLGVETSFGRKFRGLKVTAEDTADYVERILRGYLERREPGEHFAGYVARAEEEWLR